LTFTHEAAHAAAALLVGFRLFTVSIGPHGKPLAVLRLFRCDFLFRSLLTGGYTLAHPKTARLARLRKAVFVAAGPASDLLVLVGTIWLLMEYAAQDLWTWGVMAVAWAAVIHLFVALWPQMIW